MRIYPAIDIRNGKCVRLSQGSFDNVTVYSDNPVSFAAKWEEMGAEYIHMVDLDGAQKGNSINFNIFKKAVEKVNIPIQVGGGIRDEKTIEKYLDAGISRVIIGTKAVSNPEFVKTIVNKYGEKIVIGIDAKNSMVAVEGWEKVSNFKAVDFAKKMESIGVKTIVYTDIARDGMLKGPNLQAMQEMVSSVQMDVIASGGVTDLEDVQELKKVNVEGAIIGKALYTGRIDLIEACKVAK